VTAVPFAAVPRPTRAGRREPRLPSPVRIEPGEIPSNRENALTAIRAEIVSGALSGSLPSTCVADAVSVPTPPLRASQLASDYEPNLQDSIDNCFAWHLKRLPLEIAASVMVQRIKSGVYDINSSRVHLDWFLEGGRMDVCVKELPQGCFRGGEAPGIHGAPTLLPDYLRQLLKYDVAADPTVGGSAVLLVPQSQRLSFQGGPSDYLEGDDMSRFDAMRLACKQAVMREKAAEASLSGKPLPKWPVKPDLSRSSDKVTATQEKGHSPPPPPPPPPPAPLPEQQAREPRQQLFGGNDPCPVEVRLEVPAVSPVVVHKDLGREQELSARAAAAAAAATALLQGAPGELSISDIKSAAAKRWPNDMGTKSTVGFSLAPGDHVHVFSASAQSWAKDGLVQEVLDSDRNVGGTLFGAGSVQVMYNGGTSMKWVPLDSISTHLRKATELSVAPSAKAASHVEALRMPSLFGDFLKIAPLNQVSIDNSMNFFQPQTQSSNAFPSIAGTGSAFSTTAGGSTGGSAFSTATVFPSPVSSAPTTSGLIMTRY